MKKALLIAVPLLLLAGSGFFLYRWWKHPVPPKGFELPSGCNFVAVLNTHSIMEELYRFQKRNPVISDTASIKHFIKQSKVDLLKPVYFFGDVDGEFKGICTAFSDLDSLKKTMKNIGFIAPEKNRDSFVFKEYSAIISKENQLVYCYYKRPLGLSNKTSILSAQSNKMLGKPFESEELCRGLIDMEAVNRFVSDDKLKHDSVVSFTMKLAEDKFTIRFNGVEVLSGINKANPISLQMSYKVLSNAKIFTEITRAAKKVGIDTTGWKGSEGDLKFDLKGVLKTKIKYVTYALDDEFNRVEKVSYKEKTTPDFSLFIPVKNNKWYELSSTDSVGIKEYKVKNFFGTEIHFLQRNKEAAFFGDKISDNAMSDKGLLWIDVNKTRDLIAQLGLPAKQLVYAEQLSTIGILNAGDRTVDFEIKFKKDWTEAILSLLTKRK